MHSCSIVEILSYLIITLLTGGSVFICVRVFRTLKEDIKRGL